MATFLFGVVVGVLVNLLTALFSRKHALQLIPWMCFYIAVHGCWVLLDADPVRGEAMKLAQQHSPWVLYPVAMLTAAILAGFYVHGVRKIVARLDMVTQPKQEQAQVQQPSSAAPSATPQTLRDKEVREQLGKLNRAELEVVHIILIHGHIMQNQIELRLDKEGFPTQGVVDNTRTKTTLLMGSFAGDISITPELKESVEKLLPEYLTPLPHKAAPEHPTGQKNKIQLPPQPPSPVMAFDSSLAAWRLRNKPYDLELHDLFLTDFESVQQKTYGAVFVDDAQQISVQYGLHVELALRTKFLVFYIGRQDQHTAEICTYLANHYQFILDKSPQLLIEQKAPGDSGTISTKEAVFSNRIYIYHETYLPAEATVQITKLYEQRGLSVILRSVDYLSNKKMEAEVRRLRGN